MNISGQSGKVFFQCILALRLSSIKRVKHFKQYVRIRFKLAAETFFTKLYQVAFRLKTRKSMERQWNFEG